MLPFKYVSHLKAFPNLTGIKFSWYKRFSNHLIHSCIKIPSVKFVPNSSLFWSYIIRHSGSLELFEVAYITLALAIYITPFQFYYILTGSLQPSVLVLYHIQSGSLYLPIPVLHQTQSAILHFSIPVLCHTQFSPLQLSILVIFQIQSYYLHLSNAVLPHNQSE
jgi:hypothetical protein